MLKYLIIGAGGTGLPIGTYLAKAGKDVTFIARGENLKVIKNNGVKITIPQNEFVIAPVNVTELESYNERVDVIFVCVKGYSLDSIIPHMQRIADKDTVIIPILNIFGTGGELQKYFPESLVTDGCIYIAAQVSAPGCILMNGDIFRIIYGVRKKEEYRERLRDIESDLRESGITGILSDNIARDALLKFSYVSPQGACGLYYNVSAGEIQKQGEIRDCFAGLVTEINSLALAMDIYFDEDIVQRNLDILDTLTQNATTSLQRDIADNHQSEIDGLIYEVVRLADKYGADVPLYRKISDELRKRGL